MKLKTHYYMAQILFHGIKSSSYIPYSDIRCEYAEGLYEAVAWNGEAFYAGVLGPDVYPDMLFGESKIHSGKNINPALWLAMMLEEFRNNYDYKSKEGREVYAFIVGWAAHYACDIFMNTYISHALEKAKALPGSDLDKALRRAIEAYLDKFVSRCRYSSDIKIKAPYGFLKRFFLEDRRICFASAESRSEFVRKKPKEDKSKTPAKDTKNTNDAKEAQSAAMDDSVYDEIEMLDFSEESLDIFYLLGGIKRALFYDENAPFEEQAEIGKSNPALLNRDKHLKTADELTDEWINIHETLAGKLLDTKQGESINEKLLSDYKEKLNEFLIKLKELLVGCRAVLGLHGLPKWLLDFLQKQNRLNLGELAGMLNLGSGPVKGEISFKISGPLSLVTKQIKNIIDYSIEKTIPKMLTETYKKMEKILASGDPETMLSGHWDKEKVDAAVKDFGLALTPTSEKFIPFKDAMTLAMLGVLGKSFGKLTEKFRSISPKIIQLMYDDPKKGKFNLVKPKSFPPATKRLRFSVRAGEAKSVEICGVKYGDYLVAEVNNDNNFNRRYILLEKFYQYTDVKEVTLKVKYSVPESKFLIALEAEDPKSEKKWKDLLIIMGMMNSESECSVVHTENLPEHVDRTPPKVSISGGYAYVTIPVTYKKLSKEEAEEYAKKSRDKLDFDVGAFFFIRSLVEAKEWRHLEKENHLFYYLLRTMTRLNDECYR